jgi:hypothetical protein
MRRTKVGLLAIQQGVALTLRHYPVPEGACQIYLQRQVLYVFFDDDQVVIYALWLILEASHKDQDLLARWQRTLNQLEARIWLVAILPETRMTILKS